MNKKIPVVHHTKTIKYQIIEINGDRMPFCTSCGKEVPPGKKFCEYCGTPLEQPAVAPAASAIPAPVPLAPVIPPAAQQPQSGGSGKTMVIAGIILVLVIIAGVYFIGLPMMGGSQGSGKSSQQPTHLQTPAPALIQTPPVSVTAQTPVSTNNPAASQTYEEKYMESYNQVYSVNRAFVGGQKEVFSQDLRNPPLYIKFNITPEIEVGEKVDDAGKMVSTSYVSPASWFKVSIYDAGNGALVEEQGFGSAKGFSVTTQQEFMVRAPGNYRIEISGNDVIAEARILTGKS